MPECCPHGQTPIRWRQFQDFIPAMEPHAYEDWIGHVDFGHWHVAEHRSDVSSQLISSLRCVREIATHAVAGCEEVEVVAVIHHVVHAAGLAALPQIYSVGFSPDRIAMGCR